MTAVDERDEWMKRTGPFYPLLVAFRLHTRLPVAADLEPTAEDLSRAAPWTIAVAFASGGALAVLAWLLLRTPLVPAIVATLLVAIGVFVSGAFAEHGLASVLARRIGAGAAVGSGHLLAAVLLRIGLLLGTAPEAWASALVLSTVAGKLAQLVAVRPPWSAWLAGNAVDAGEGDGDPLARGLSPSRWVAVASVVVLGAIAFAGAHGLLAIAASTAFGAFARRRHFDADMLVGACELMTLVVVAASSPAVVSPLIARP